MNKAMRDDNVRVEKSPKKHRLPRAGREAIERCPGRELGLEATKRCREGS
jgi:hypothetical protein